MTLYPSQRDTAPARRAHLTPVPALQGLKNQTQVKLNIVSCPPVTTVLIKRPDLKYQLGFSVQNGIVSPLLQATLGSGRRRAKDTGREGGRALAAPQRQTDLHPWQAARRGLGCPQLWARLPGPSAPAQARPLPAFSCVCPWFREPRRKPEGGAGLGLVLPLVLGQALLLSTTPESRGVCEGGCGSTPRPASPLGCCDSRRRNVGG